MSVANDKTLGFHHEHRQWRDYLWPSEFKGAQEPESKDSPSPKDSKIKSVRDVIMLLLGIQHSDQGVDYNKLLFEAGLVILSDLVPGAVPKVLIFEGKRHSSTSQVVDQFVM